VRADGAALPVEALDRIGALLSSVRTPATVARLEEVRRACDPASLAAFVWALFEAWLGAGARSRDKWAFVAVSWGGGATAVPRLTELAETWAEERRPLVFEVLEAVGSDEALRAIWRIGRERDADEEATRALEAAARRRGLTLDALVETILPTTGLKNPGALVKEQTTRLERAMCDGRTWPAPLFRRLAANPLLAAPMRSLVWAASARRLVTFRIAEDGTFADESDAPFALHDTATVTLPHPLLLKAETLERWRQLFSDYAIVQPFLQLERPFFRSSPQELRSSTIKRFAGVATSRNRMFGLRHRGWRGTGHSQGQREFYLQKPFENGRYVASMHVRDLTLGSLHLRTPEGFKKTFRHLSSITFSELIADIEWARA
jgi:hypothetical protein